LAQSGKPDWPLQHVYITAREGRSHGGYKRIYIPILLCPPKNPSYVVRRTT